MDSIFPQPTSATGPRKGRKKIQTYVWVTVPMRKWLEAEATRSGRSFSEIVREVLAEKMKKSGA